MRSRAAALGALACVFACAGWPAVARGVEVAAAQVRSLGEAAQRDPEALARLREVRVVDRRAGAAPPATAGAGTAARAREQARDILAQRRFHSSSVPAPLRSVRERIGDGLRKLGRPFEDLFKWVAGWLPGGKSVLWGLLAALVLGGAAVLAARAGARRRLAAGDAPRGEGGRERESAAQLRREAERAERAGDLDRAVRLRFRAGLLELDSRELIELRPALTNRELLREVPSPTLEGLVDGFEAVAYGGRSAEEDDVRSAREGWPRVPDEAGRR